MIGSHQFGQGTEVCLHSEAPGPRQNEEVEEGAPAGDGVAHASFPGGQQMDAPAVEGPLSGCQSPSTSHTPHSFPDKGPSTAESR